MKKTIKNAISSLTAKLAALLLLALGCAGSAWGADVAKIGDTPYASIDGAFTAAQAGDTITLLADVTPSFTDPMAITQASVIDLNGKTLNITKDDLRWGTTTFKNGNIVVDPSVHPSTAVFYMFGTKTLTFDNVKITATGVSGNYIIDLEAPNCYLNIVNGSEIILDNASATSLTAVIAANGTHHTIVIDDSTATVKNVGTFILFGDDITIKGASDIALENIAKRGILVKAGATLSVEDTAKVTVSGTEPSYGGIYVADNTSKYIVADTATVTSSVTLPEGYDPNAALYGTKVADGFYQKANTYAASTDFYITSKAGLEYFRDLVNGKKSVTDDYMEKGFYSAAGFHGQFYSNNLFSGKTVHLCADIDLENSIWEPIGYVHAYTDAEKAAYYVETTENSGKVSAKTYFYGNFDGQNHKISNIRIENSDTNTKGEYGLFGRIGGDGAGQSFSNLTLETVSASVNGWYVGAIVGNGGTNTTTFDKCHVIGNINISSKASGAFVGGIVGTATSTIDDCSVEGSTGSTIEGSTVGGLAGTSTRTAKENANTVTDSTVTGVTVKSDDNGGQAGGLVGKATNPVTVTGNTVHDVTVSAENGKADALVGGVGGDVTASSNTTDTNVTVISKPEAKLGSEDSAGKGMSLAELAASWGAAYANEVITLGQDVALDKRIYFYKGVTIDLNGHKLTLQAEDERGFYLDDGSIMVLKDSGTGGTFEHAYVGGIAIFVRTGSSLTFKNGIYNVGGNLTYNNGGTIAIESGVYTVGLSNVAIWTGSGTSTVSGGYFNVTRDTINWVVDGKLVEEVKEGQYAGYYLVRDIVDSDYVAENTTTGKRYLTLSDAMAEAKSGEVVQLIKAAVSGTLSFVPDGVVFNDNGFASTMISGAGTPSDPYLIKDIDLLKAFRNSVNAGSKFAGKYFKLTSDIDLNNEEWTPIGDYYKEFCGVFDGDNHTISNLRVTAGGRNAYGLFGKVMKENEESSKPAGIVNVTINNATVKSPAHWAGALAGAMYTGLAVENCHLKGDIDISVSSDGGYYAGGLVGYGGYVAYVDCSVKGNEGSKISGALYVGGIVAWHAEDSGIIRNCSVEGVSLNGKTWVGGIAGLAHYGNTVAECSVANINVAATDNGYAGQIVGLSLGKAGSLTTVVDNTVDAKTVVVTAGGEEVAVQIGTENDPYAIVGWDVEKDTDGKVVGGTFERLATEALADGYILSEPNAQGLYTVEKEPVAQIGETKYTSLAAAVEAVPENGAEATTIKMIADVELDATVTIPANKNVVLDLNGKTVSGAISGAPVIRNNGTLAIADSGNAGTIANTLDDSSTSVKLSGAVNNYGTLTLNGGSYSTSVGGSYVIYTGEGATTVNDCTVTGGAMKGVFQTAGGTLVVNDADVDVSCKYYVFDLRAGATVTVAGGTFNCAKAFYQQMINLALKEGGENTLNIAGGTFTFSSTALQGDNQPEPILFNGTVAEGATAAVNISGGAFSYGSPYFAWLNGGATLTDSSVSISGGIFNVSPVWNTQSDSLIAADYEVVSNTDAATKDDYPYTVISAYEAQIVRNGEVVTPKGTLAEMVAAAQADDTVQLLADISDLSTVTVNAGQNVTLDLNGHTIEAGLEQAGRHYYAIDNYGTFTLKDSSESQTGKIRARGIVNNENSVMIVDGGIIEAIDTNGGAAIWNEGTLTMNGGVLRATHVGSSSDQYGPGALNNRGTATITKADIQSANKRTYAIVSSGAITINPAKDDDVIVAGAHGGLAVDSGTATVTGGRFSSTEYYGLYVSNDGTGTAAKAQVTVSGGEFTGNTQSVHIGSDVNTPVDSVIAISGGTFHGTIFAENKVTEDGGILVSGGSFENPVPEAYCADGYIPNAEQDSETGMYTVKTGSYVAQNTTTGVKYETLAAAIEAASAGDTVTLLDNINLGSVTLVINKALTLDGAYSITSSAAAAIDVVGTGNVTIKCNVTATNGHGINVGNSAHYGGKLTVDGSTVTVAKRGINVFDVDSGFALEVKDSTIQSNVADPTTTYTTGEDSRGINFSSDPLTYSVTITDSTIQGFSYDINVYSGSQNITLTMTGGATYGRAALNIWGSNNTFTMNGVTINGLNNQTGPTEAFACIVENTGAANNVYNVNGCTFNASLSTTAASASGSSATEQMIDLRGSGSNVNITGNTTYAATVGGAAVTDENADRFGFLLNDAAIEDNTVTLDATALANLGATISEDVDKTTHVDSGTGVVTLALKVYVAQNTTTGTKYESLQAALDAANDGETIKLLDDLDVTDAMYSGDSRFNLWISKSITLDGDDHTLTVKGRGIGVQGASSNIDVTLTNLTVENVGNENGRCVDTRGKLNSLTLDGVSLTTGTSSYTGYLQPLTIGGNQSTHTTVTITNSFIETVAEANKGYAITTFNPVNMTITDSYIAGWSCLNIKGADSSAGSAGSNIQVIDSALVSANGTPGYSNSYSLIKIEDDNVNVSITGTAISVNGGDNTQSIVSFQKMNQTSSANCTVSMGADNEVTLEGDYRFESNAGETSGLEISGGAFNVEVPEDACAPGYIPQATETTDPETGNPVTVYGVKQGTYVARNTTTGQGYETLQAAITAASAGDTVALLQDVTATSVVEITKSITLDGNGHSLNTSAKRAIWIDSGDVDVTIKNLTIPKNSKVERAIQVNLDCDDVKLTISNVTATATMYTINVCNNVDRLDLDIIDSDLTGWGVVNLWGNNGTVLVSGSTLNGVNDKTYNADGWNDFGVIVVEGDTTGQTDAHASAYSVTVTNSTISATSTTGNGQSVILYNDPSVSNGITLEDTTVVLGNANCTFLLDQGEGSTTKLKGTTVQSTSEIPVLPEGYCYVDDAQGYHVVTKAVAMVVNTSATPATTNYFASLSAALDAAQSGDTVTLLSNCSGSGIIVPQDKFPNGLTVDFGGFTYTVNNDPLAGSTGTKNQAFQLLKGNKVTFKDGAIVADNAGVKMLIQNYADLTLDNMTLDATQGNNSVGYVLSTNNGSTTIKDTTIVAKENGVAFDACSGWGGYASNEITVTGTSAIAGDIEVSFYGQENTSAPTVNLNSGTHTGAIKVARGFGEATVYKTSEFNQEPPADYKWVETETSGVYQLVPKVYVVQNVNTEVKYETLAEAFAAANTGDTVKLLADITYGTDKEVDVFTKAVNLDLGGFTLKTQSTVSTTEGNNGYKAAAVCYSIEGSDVKKVTVSNGSIETAYGAGVYADGLGLELTLANLTIRAATVGTQTTKEYSSAVRITGNAKVVIANGTYTGPNAIAVSNSGGRYVINGGDFDGDLYISTYANSGVAQTVEIADGKFKGNFVKGSGEFAISGGVFSVQPDASYPASGYVVVDNADAATKDAYPYTVAETIAQFVYPIEGTAGLPIPSDWLAANSVAGYSDAEQPILATMTNAMVTALSGKADNGMPMWQSYVLGLTPNGANATALRLAATAKDATTVTITAAVNVPATLENSGTTVSFRLVEQNADGTWTDIEAGKASPSFDVSLDTVAGKVLTIFADIVTE